MTAQSDILRENAEKLQVIFQNNGAGCEGIVIFLIHLFCPQLFKYCHHIRAKKQTM